MTIISLSLPEELLADLDSLAEEAGFASRSEVVRHAIRGLLSERALERLNAEKTVATITALHDRLANRELITNLQHNYDDVIKSLLHMHLDERNCIEVMVVEGRGRRLTELLNGLRALKGVKQAKLCTTVSV